MCRQPAGQAADMPDRQPAVGVEFAGDFEQHAARSLENDLGVGPGLLPDGGDFGLDHDAFPATEGRFLDPGKAAFVVAHFGPGFGVDDDFKRQSAARDGDLAGRGRGRVVEQGGAFHAAVFQRCGGVRQREQQAGREQPAGDEQSQGQ
jgi:hypothetical protein